MRRLQPGFLPRNLLRRRICLHLQRYARSRILDVLRVRLACTIRDSASRMSRAVARSSRT
jgi:hypothetical protein